MPTDIHALLANFLAAYNIGDWDGLFRYVGNEYVHHSGEQVLDGAGFVRGAQWLRKGFPDFTVEAVDVLVDGDRAAVRFQARGTHADSLFGEAPSGRTVVLDGITVYRIADGVIAEDWEAMDEQQLRRQLS